MQHKCDQTAEAGSISDRKRTMMGYRTQDNEPEPVAASDSADRPTSPHNDEEATPIQVGGRHWRQHVRDFYERNFGLFLVFSAQTFGSVVRLFTCLNLASKSSTNTQYPCNTSAYLYESSDITVGSERSSNWFIDEHGGKALDV